MAVAGNDYCIVAGSTRLSTGYSILTRERSMITPMCAHFISLAALSKDANIRVLHSIKALDLHL